MTDQEFERLQSMVRQEADRRKRTSRRAHDLSCLESAVYFQINFQVEGGCMRWVCPSTEEERKEIRELALKIRKAKKDE